jgi:hypothetical protein
MVLTEGILVPKAANQLKIKLSTAKHILKIYKT